MSWNDNNNKNDGNMNSPWGKRPTPERKNDEFEEFLKNSQKKFQKFFNDGQNNKGRSLTYLIMIPLALWLGSGFYNVEEGEQAVIMRFGKFVRIAEPGLNYHLPAPAERTIIQKVGRVEKEEIGYRFLSPTSGNLMQRSSQRNFPEESLMLTGDENIIEINFDVYWKINNIKNYVFNIHKPKETLKSAAESAMREVIGNTPMTAALTGGRSVIESTTKELLQNTLDSYVSGIEVVSVKLTTSNPPVEVIDAFRDVQTARADKEREINQAQSYQNDIIPRARGDAARIAQEAEGYKQEVIARAQGEASRFNSVYEQYKNAKDVTRKRIYLETMENIMKGMNKVILDSKKGAIPYLPLPQITNVKPKE
jgi:membrane protease subunit HflK